MLAVRIMPPDSAAQTAFKTEADGDHIGDDYFINSNDKVRFSIYHRPNS